MKYEDCIIGEIAIKEKLMVVVPGTLGSRYLSDTNRCQDQRLTWGFLPA